MAVSLVRVMAPTAEAAPAVVMPGAAAGEPSSWLVGRDQELATLLALLDPRPQGPAGVVLTGMAGVGKTALACQAARIAVGRGWFPGGAVIVDLRGPDPNPVTPKWVYDSLLRALDPDSPAATVDEQASAHHHLMSHLDQVTKPMLLVLDNVEHTDQIAGLLPAGGAHRVLIASRHPLEGLPGASRLDVDVLAPDLAIELLGTRRPGDPRLGADPAAAAELARLCGHLPLALQIIAVLMADDPARPTAELVEELADETTRLQGLPGERWAGRAAVEMAYRRLDDIPARLFRLLATVPGADVSAQAAAALSDQPVEMVRQTLAALARAHLLECRQPGRWRMHDQIRSHATAHALRDGFDVGTTRSDVDGVVDTPPPRDVQPAMSAGASTSDAVHAANIPPLDTIVAPRPPRATRHGRMPNTDRRQRQRRHRLLLTTATALIIAIALAVFALLKPFIVGANAGATRLVLSTSQVKIGDTYLLTASGFSPGEPVRFSWTGPSEGVMGVFPADSSGTESPGPVFERHPPGNYTITVTGLTSGRTASAGLRVVTGTGAARLVLSTSEVKIGDTYFATAWGFSPEENVRFSINRTNDVIGVFPVGTGGGRWQRVLEKDPPGDYTIIVTGLTSGRTASAGLTVIQPAR